MIKEHDRVILNADIPGDGLKAGDVGSVVHVYRDGAAYEVEFVALDGKTLAGTAEKRRRWHLRFGILQRGATP